MRLTTCLALLTPLFLAAPLSSQNLLLNGDFESNTASGCDFNLANTTFTGMMANCVGFGTANEIDIMLGACGYGSPPQSGTTKVGIACKYPYTSDVDAFGMELSAPLVSGASYRLVFYVEAELYSFSPDIGNVEIGVSTTGSAFGTLVLTGTPSGSGWTRIEGSFTAPMAATWLTVRQQTSTDSWNHVDNFVLEPDFALSSRGSCPGSMTFSVTGETPGGDVAFVYGSPGSFTWTGSPCTGTTLDIANPTLAQLSTATSLTANVPAAACRRIRVQAVDVSTCKVSNFVDL